MLTESRPLGLALILLSAQLTAAVATALFPVHQKAIVFLAVATLASMAGDCHAQISPLVIGAYKKGESSDAIALDQILLRSGEQSFELWVPDEGIEIRVVGPAGPHRIQTTVVGERVRIDLL